MHANEDTGRQAINTESNSSDNSFAPRLLTLALFVIAFLVPVSPELGSIGLRPEDLLLVVLGVILLVDVLVRPRLELLGREFFGALTAVWLASALATAIGALLGTATLLSLNPIESGLLTVAKEAELLVLFLLVVRYVRVSETAKRLIDTLCLGATMLASLLILELLLFEHGALVPHQQFHLMGEIFAFAASLAAGRLFFGSPTDRGHVLYAGCLGITGVGILVSGEAGAMIGAAAAAAMLTFIVLESSRLRVSRRMIALGGAGGIIALSLVVVLVPDVGAMAGNQIADILSILSGDPRNSTQVRFRHWAERIPNVLTSRPLLGFGQMAIPPGGLDNEYFQRLYYTGLLGLGAYVYLLLTATRTAFATVDRDETGFAAGYAGVVGVMLGAGLAKGVFHSTKTSAIFVMCSALVFVLLYRDGFDGDG